MKKIVAVAAAGLTLAGAAFADVSFSWTRTNIVSGTSKAFNSVERTDCLGLELSNDIAGVVFDWDIEENEKSAASGLALDSYYGWMTFGLPVGNLQVTSGKWVSRYADRVKADAGDLDSAYYEANKMGVINGSLGKDSNNLTEGNMATVLAYTLADKLPGTLLVKGGIVNFGSDYGNWWDSASGFVAEAAYRQEGLINVNVAWKSEVDETFSLAAFVSPLMVENLKATAGFTFAKSDVEDADGKEFGVDLRARYALTDKTAVTGMFNYSKTEFTQNVNNEDLESMWFMASINHVAGDNISFKATVNHQINDLAAKQGTKVESALTPACVIDITEKASLTAAFDMRWSNKTPYAGVGDVSLPIYVTIGL